MIDDVITELTAIVGVRAACAAVGRPRASHYRRHRASPAPLRPPPPEPRPQARALTLAKRQQVLVLLHEERFVDLSPGEVHAILLDEGRYLRSESTMYRLLRTGTGPRGFRVGRSVRYWRTEVALWLEEQSRSPRDEL